ncbi:unnamed protein product, partial [Protopolystoma xenopodis]
MSRTSSDQDIMLYDNSPSTRARNVAGCNPFIFCQIVSYVLVYRRSARLLWLIGQSVQFALDQLVDRPHFLLRLLANLTGLDSIHIIRDFFKDSADISSVQTTTAVPTSVYNENTSDESSTHARANQSGDLKSTQFHLMGLLDSDSGQHQAASQEAELAVGSNTHSPHNAALSSSKSSSIFFPQGSAAHTTMTKHFSTLQDVDHVRLDSDFQVSGDSSLPSSDVAGRRIASSAVPLPPVLMLTMPLNLRTSADALLADTSSWMETQFLQTYSLLCSLFEYLATQPSYVDFSNITNPNNEAHSDRLLELSPSFPECMVHTQEAAIVEPFIEPQHLSLQIKQSQEAPTAFSASTEELKCPNSLPTASNGSKIG